MVNLICKKCNKPFYRSPSRIEHVGSDFCSTACKYGIKKRVLCNHAYKDEWGKVKICKELRKRYRKTCGGHINGTKQRYFCSVINPNYCIDITL